MEIRFNNEIYDLELKGLRKLLHEDVDAAFYDLDDYDSFMDDIKEIHALISAKDVQGLIDGFFCNGDIVFFEVESDDFLANALDSAGYKFQKSNVSRSIYAINDNGEEVRIADHIRPAIVQNGVYIGEHEYKHQIIVKNNVVHLNELKANGFSKLTKPEYILG